MDGGFLGDNPAAGTFDGPSRSPICVPYYRRAATVAVDRASLSIRRLMSETAAGASGFAYRPFSARHPSDALRAQVPEDGPESSRSLVDRCYARNVGRYGLDAKHDLRSAVWQVECFHHALRGVTERLEIEVHRQILLSP